MSVREMDAVQLLTIQHRALERLLQEAAEEQDAKQKQMLVNRAGDELMVHLTSEEKIFYPAVRAARTEDILLESLEEHLSLKRLLADLLALDPNETTYEPKFKVLKEQAEHHHREEEEHLFPKVTRLMPEDQRHALGKEMLEMQVEMAKAGKPREDASDQTGAAAPLE
ncbi:Hemerythrin HHE cation binding domain-containing protein [Noviherbaspirillum humi]|uniref:Hemerythrin HHE cation binding domain-containing protein n=1 Tax=Noviherbaspirillum humi TaxID=1688639 RepID=A0A239K226_9BURK|nr:hemerythrin domain-containing protein [Noviherbaspirillum humi]SNT11723.1 Hemerythrin HHE cation binding domain-containing protein [Noviherbaspirillum humi]